MATTVGERIRQLRERRGMSQAALTAGIPLSSSYVSLIETGKREPSPQVVATIAERLGCSAEYLATGRGGEEAKDLELELRFAELALRSGDAETARTRFADVLRHAVEWGYDDLVHDARWGLCRAQEKLGDLEAAIEGLQLLAREERLPGSISRTAVVNGLCRTWLETGDLTRSVELAETTLHDLRTQGQADGDEALELTSTLVACYYTRGDISSAHRLARNLIAEAERGGSSRARAAAYWNAGVVAEARGDLRTAHVYTDRALALYGESDNARNLALVRMNCAWLLLRLPEADHRQARTLLQQALKDLLQVGSQVDVARAEIELARCCLFAGKPGEAVDSEHSSTEDRRRWAARGGKGPGTARARPARHGGHRRSGGLVRHCGRRVGECRGISSSRSSMA